ncbi:putative pyoverdine/dityrosine biosynthesis protein [Aspergillus uvarum CBS 121591]|uniref:Putative pyoverdine/dityrosine biosynthesis protein n=1 Tax=Aspergillus uvarum CBS 121591 TaxID=1448315 RepID=A0A319CJF1_9EURO|nr:putative pyoverdine/dityrosine biosynthesis protein [Aspergillus uvarum CBS 121591]PYH85785.1 putative pyoverdine/dityrosine biosynthesis protein [Aspergillus uvarum CBS 121591]
MSAVMVQPPIAQSTLTSVGAEPIFDLTTLQKAWEILSIIYRYRMPVPASLVDRSDEGTLKFLSLIYTRVRAGKSVSLILPAFPFKSPNQKDKVLGTLPDKGEDLALAHLNGLCAAIADIYEPGARLTIASDGLVYNDLLGVPDAEVYTYGEALRKMVQTQGYRHLQFIRLRDLVHWKIDTPLDATTYEKLAGAFRQRLIDNFTPLDYDCVESIKADEDVCTTYRGYIRFLTKDLEHTFVEGGEVSKKSHKQKLEGIAKQMIARGKAFAEAIKKNYPDHVRLSIHPSCGSAKISVQVLPLARHCVTPWHSTPCFTLDGRVEYGLRESFDHNPDVELVHKAGQPWLYRYKSELYSWPQPVEIEPQYPCGLIIRPTQPMSCAEVDMHKLRALAEENSPVILRGFQDTRDRELFVKKAEEMGTPVGWKFGLILEVKDHGTDTQGLNNVLSSEWMPFHYDGLFKIVKMKNADGQEVVRSCPPKFQFFTGMTPSPKDTGFTLFSPSHLVWHYLPSEYSVEHLRTLSWTVETVSFDHTKIIDLPLVVDHFAHQRPCLRYHEPWPQEKTVFDPTKITIQDVPNSKELCQTLDSLLHDRRVAYWHCWEEGDWLISDNVTTMHTRSSFTGNSDRCLRRIHVD